MPAPLLHYLVYECGQECWLHWAAIAEEAETGADKTLAEWAQKGLKPL